MADMNKCAYTGCNEEVLHRFCHKHDPVKKDPREPKTPDVFDLITRTRRVNERIRIGFVIALAAYNDGDTEVSR